MFKEYTKLMDQLLDNKEGVVEIDGNRVLFGVYPKKWILTSQIFRDYIPVEISEVLSGSSIFPIQSQGSYLKRIGDAVYYVQETSSLSRFTAFRKAIKLFLENVKLWK